MAKYGEDFFKCLTSSSYTCAFAVNLPAIATVCYHPNVPCGTVRYGAAVTVSAPHLFKISQMHYDSIINSVLRVLIQLILF